TGPAVLGIVRPEVVVPAWLLDEPAEAQRLVVMHEREHVRARDPLLLVAGCAMAALIPWSPAAWWMLLRLRAAVEMDCDARVLRRGVKTAAYGTLLIDMAGRSPGLALGAPAMAGWPSTLERRLRAMNARLPRFANTRAGLLAVLASTALVVACESTLPTSAEVEKMDVAAVETRAGQFQTIIDGDRAYYVDDVKVTAEQARALSADAIARVEVRKSEAGGGEVRVYTKDGGLATTSADLSKIGDREFRIVPDGEARGQGQALASVYIAEDGEGAKTSGTVTVDGASGQARGQLRVRTAAGATGSFDGLVLVDGVVSDPGVLRTLNTSDIETIDVLKGSSATAQYSDPRAANGVIRITTKGAARH
ncbi:MAG TPA: M56 family metallopeptidase, partial [Longimicrobium sp.]|nr:M56 family metallopeptidase [Longimicrobium sp.]